MSQRAARGDLSPAQQKNLNRSLKSWAKDLSKKRLPSRTFYQLSDFQTDVVDERAKRGCVKRLQVEILGAATLLTLAFDMAVAADHKALMKGTGTQSKDFEPTFLKIAVGDTASRQLGNLLVLGELFESAELALALVKLIENILVSRSRSASPPPFLVCWRCQEHNGFPCHRGRSAPAFEIFASIWLAVIR